MTIHVSDKIEQIKMFSLLYKYDTWIKWLMWYQDRQRNVFQIMFDSFSAFQKATWITESCVVVKGYL